MDDFPLSSFQLKQLKVVYSYVNVKSCLCGYLTFFRAVGYQMTIIQANGKRIVAPRTLKRRSIMTEEKLARLGVLNENAWETRS